jgi:hypothetical protein
MVEHILVNGKNDKNSVYRIPLDLLDIPMLHNVKMATHIYPISLVTFILY